MIDYRFLFKSFYQEDIPDARMIEEAITTLENYFDLLTCDELCHHRRPLAIAYLALRCAESTLNESETQ